MLIKCGKCGLEYDDAYHLTYCPHAKFSMRTIVGKINENGVHETMVCTDLHQIDTFINGTQDRN